MSKLVTIQQAAALFGVSTQTLRRWEREGKGVPVQRTQGGQRRYDLSKMRPSSIKPSNLSEGPTLAYARVSSHDQKEDQKEDLQRQEKMLEMFCSSKGWTFEIITVFSARLYGSRSRKNKQLIANLEKAVVNAT